MIQSGNEDLDLETDIVSDIIDIERDRYGCFEKFMSNALTATVIHWCQ